MAKTYRRLSYCRRTRERAASARGRLRLLEHFVAVATARSAAELVGVNRNMKNRFYLALRQIIAEEMEKAAPLHVEVEGSGRKKATPATGAKAGEVGKPRGKIYHSAYRGAANALTCSRL